MLTLNVRPHRVAMHNAERLARIHAAKPLCLSHQLKAIADAETAYYACREPKVAQRLHAAIDVLGA
jgi:hypothetical protein